MKFFIDTANIDEIRQAKDMGVLDGVTTNPSLISKEDGRFEEIVKEILKEVEGPVSVEVVSTEAPKMLEEAKEYAAFADNVVIKVPMIKEGLRAVKMISAEGIKTNMTLIFSASQALLAAKAGATYASPFIGRLDDRSSDGMELIREIVTVYDNYSFDTEILVASVRHPMHVLESALLGADVATIPLDVIDKLLDHPLTDSGLERFLEDWEKVEK